MAKSVSNYPIGASWKYIDQTGKVGNVWLAEISYGHEIWRWSWMYSDGSGGNFDYAYNKAEAVKQCSASLDGNVRFKRVK